MNRDLAKKWRPVSQDGVESVTEGIANWKRCNSRAMRSIHEQQMRLMMNEKKTTVERRGNVLLMGLNRPDKMNAFDVEMYLELSAALGELHRDGELRCGLLFIVQLIKGKDRITCKGIGSAGLQFPDKFVLKQIPNGLSL